MIKSFFWLKTVACLLLFAIFVFGIFGFGNDNKIKYTGIKNIDAAETSCKGPADVILVIDRSATMINYEKFNIAKTASINFIDKLFAASPDDIYYPNDYHQIGLVAFHNLIDNEELNKNGDYIKGIINQSDGIFGGEHLPTGYPYGYRNTSSAIDTARNSLDLDLSSPNPSATKTMIILTDGAPNRPIDNPIGKAENSADSAKDNKGIRIISVGLKLDSIADETEKTEAEEFIKYIASAPFDCYYASDSGSVLDGCNSVSADNLADALEGVYTSITAAICDENPPSISISREPSGTLYSVDNLIITSTAIDDVGFNAHSVKWSDNWSDPDTIRNIECGDLAGTEIECSVGGSGEVGPFPSGTNVSYRSSAIDANNNEATIELPNPRNVTVADVILTVPALLRNGDKTITVEISNYVVDEIFISIDAPILDGIEIEKEPMICSGTGSDRTCTYNFNTNNIGDGCLDWTDGITNGFANNIYVDIYIYAQSNDIGIRQIASSENNLLASSFEGPDSLYPGTCTDSINNDCDYKDNDPLQPIIDLNPGLDEALCDITGPDIGILRDPSGGVYDDDSIVFTSNATDSNGIKQHTIFYRENSGIWQTIPDSDSASISGTLGPLSPGVVIEYYSWAMDYSGNDNENSTAMESFIVKNRACEFVGNLGDCNSPYSGKCCNEVCNTAISNPNSYNTDHCAEEICNGISWEYGPANDTDICSESGEPTECHSFFDLYGPPPGDPFYFYDGGCEERAYRCSSGYCDYESPIIKEDHCIGGGSLILNDYECVGTSCVLDPDPAVESGVCDVGLDYLSLNAYNSDSVFISGSSIVENIEEGEVLNNLTDKVSLRSVTNDSSGIGEHNIYWKRTTDSTFNVKNCDIGLCGATLNPCVCTEDIGPFNVGEIIAFYSFSKDESVNQTERVLGPNGLRYYYYDGTNFNTYKGSGIDTNLDHSWGYGTVRINNEIWENQSSTVSVVWEGFIRPNISGEHTFYVSTDDGIRLYIDENLLIDKWFYHSGTTEYSSTYNFTSFKPVPIRIEWYERYSRATMKLGWDPPNNSKVYPIPSNNLISSYSFTVRDGECYDIPGGSKPNLTLCNSGSGMCCGGTCDISPNPTFYDEGCYVDACSGTSWVYITGNEDNSCGTVGTCFDYYNGCVGGNKCASGYCNPDPTGIQVDFCSSNLFTDYECSGLPESCGAISVGTDCSADNNIDGDSVACNCDCDNYDIEEKVYSSLNFDGVDDYVNIPNSSSLNPQKVTLEAWIYPTSFPSFATIIRKGNLSIRFYLNTGRIRGYAYNGNSPYYCNTPSYVAASLNQWNHVVFTYDGNMGKIYINGIEGCSYSSTGDLYSSSSSLSIGNYYGSSNPRYYNFKGMIDEVRMYNRALYPEEVQDHYSGIFADDTGLVGHWDFDPINAEEINEIVGDRSENVNDGSLSNVDGKLYNMDDSDWVNGKYGGGLDFDGSNDYMSLSGKSFKLTNNTTLSLWMKLDTAIGSGAHSYYPGIFSVSSGGGWNDFITFHSSGDEGRILYEDASGATRYSYLFSYNTGDWIHVAISMDSSRVPTFYINGNPEGSGVASNYVSLNYLGRGYAGATNDGAFNGLIDEVRIYNRALSDTEVADNYKGIFSDNSNLVGYWNFNEGTGTTVYDSSQNGPQWVKYGNGDDKDEDDNIINVLNRNVPAPWQVCTDVKDNDCDGDIDDYDEDNVTGASDCDGEVDVVGFTATAMNRSCVIDPDCVEGSSLFIAGNFITLDDIDIERAENDFTIETFATDEFLIKEVEIEWTTDNWINKRSKTCEDTGICKVCVEGGSCGEGNDDISSSSLSAGNIFSFRICAWDNSVNNNNKCTDYYNIVIENSNSAPEVTALLIRDHNFCTSGLEYILEWTFSDPDDDGQASYEIQIKDDDDFSDTSELIVNVEKNLSSPYYQILSDDFINNKKIEYGEDKIYYWRIRVTDSRGGGYERTSEWVEYNDLSDSDGDGNSKTFTTPMYKYPQVDFSAISDSGINCLYETSHVFIGNEDTCDLGENIMFSDSDDSFFVNCDNSDDKQCITSSASKCDVSAGLCVPCYDDSPCVKFGAGYKCEEGVCNPPNGFICDPELFSSDCKTADAARCEEGLCVFCDDDSQCSNDKFDTTGVDYFCNSIGECDRKDYREWYFYGTDGGVGSVDPNPINNYIESKDKTKYVILKIKDITGNSCYEIKKILLGGRDYPKWNESSVYNN